MEYLTSPLYSTSFPDEEQAYMVSHIEQEIIMIIEHPLDTWTMCISLEASAESISLFLSPQESRDQNDPTRINTPHE